MKSAAILFLAIVAAGLFVRAVVHSRQQNAGLPLTPAAAPVETQDSRLYALCPTVLPWQAPKSVRVSRT